MQPHRWSLEEMLLTVTAKLIVPTPVVVLLVLVLAAVVTQSHHGSAGGWKRNRNVLGVIVPHRNHNST